MEEYICYFDGACYPNPGGPMGMGYIVHFNEGTDTHYSGEPSSSLNSNNVAEYKALIALLKYFKDKEPADIHIFGDSNLVVKQMNYQYRVGTGLYREHAIEAKKLLKDLKKKHKIYICWIPREQNVEADELSKLGKRKYE